MSLVVAFLPDFSKLKPDAQKKGGGEGGDREGEELPGHADTSSLRFSR
jgi:hypothetical protein